MLQEIPWFILCWKLLEGDFVTNTGYRDMSLFLCTSSYIGLTSVSCRFPFAINHSDITYDMTYWALSALPFEFLALLWSKRMAEAHYI
ncbi:hypothetical protein F4810DRAFT_691128 [Camillea tinctor]|nr:hypothetical protein F4810DRAFT_691128 [Camillea tinctor]